MKKRVIDYIKPYGLRIAGGMSVKTAAAFCDLFIPWSLSHIIDNVIPTGSIPTVIKWGIIMLLFSLGAWTGNITANRISAGVARDATRNLRHDSFVKISYFSDKQIDDFTPSSLITRITSDSYIIHRTIGMIMRLGVRAPIMLIGGIIITLTLDPVLTLIMIATLPVAAFLIIIISKKGSRLYRKVQKATDKLLMVVRENITGIRVIKALSKSDYEKSRFAEVNGKLTEQEKDASFMMSYIDPAMSLALNLGLVAVVYVGSYRVNGGISEIGKVIAFLNYFTLILQSLMAINRMFTMLSQASASTRRIEELLNTDRELFKDTETSEFKISGIHQIEFRNVVFKYDTGNFKLNDLSFYVDKGETLGIIGATGSGKSSIVKALMRFYDVTSGSIIVDGKDIRDYATPKLRGKFGVVFQNDTLFKDTIESNVKFGRDLDDSEIKLAERIAQASDFISEAGGLHAQVAIKGTNFSGGQKQRMLIARAVAAKPQILILDDSSSALDYNTDAAMRNELKSELPDTTKIVIAQRISSIMHADRIIVLENGKIIGSGTHEYLTETCPLYREISESQIGGGFVG
jgi:ATP-binding cassette subfamily B multidrug efflux pump